ncbi:MAG: TatD family hydrolase, partial [Notoacmeibacter sp.]
ITFKTSETLRLIASTIPHDRLLVETDAPYLAPVPFRGKTNEPAYVAHTAKTLADCVGLSGEQLAEVTTENALRVFSKLPRSALKAA